MTGALDLAAKILLQADPVAIARLVLGPDVVSVHVDDAELAARPIRTDKLLRAVLRGQAEPVWLHVEVQATWRPELPRRTFEYWSAAHRHRLRIVSVVLCLRAAPRRGRIRQDYVVRVRGRVVLAFGFDVIRVWTLRTAQLLEAPGLVPLLPFASDVSYASIERGLRLLARVRSTRQRADLQSALAVFASAAFPERRWLAMIPEELRMKSSAFDELNQLARLVARREVVGELLQARLGAKRAAKYVRRLERCTDMRVLSRVVRSVGRCRDDDDALSDALERHLPPTRRRGVKPRQPSR